MPTTEPNIDPDALDCRASLSGFELEDDSDTHSHTPMDEVEGNSDEEVSLAGGAILSSENVLRAVAIFKRHLGFTDPDPPITKSRVSALTSTNTDAAQKTPLMPVDAICHDLFDTLANRKRWTAFPSAEDKAIRVDNDTWESLFRTPSVPQEAKEKARADQGLSSGLFRDEARKKLEESLFDIDQACRAGMKFSSVIMLIAEILMRAHQQLPEDETLQVSRKEVGLLLLLLGPLARLSFSQLARASIRTVKARRKNVLPTMKWPSSDTKNSLLNLPLQGTDLFAGEFQTKLELEVKRHEAVVKSGFRTPRTSQHRQPQSHNQRPNFPSSKGKSHRGRDQPRSKPSYPYRSWGMSRRIQGTSKASQPRRGGQAYGGRPVRQTFDPKP